MIFRATGYRFLFRSRIFQLATFEDMGIWSEIIWNPQGKSISSWIGPGQ